MCSGATMSHVETDQESEGGGARYGLRARPGRREIALRLILNAWCMMCDATSDVRRPTRPPTPSALSIRYRYAAMWSLPERSWRLATTARLRGESLGSKTSWSAASVSPASCTKSSRSKLTSRCQLVLWYGGSGAGSEIPSAGCDARLAGQHAESFCIGARVRRADDSHPTLDGCWRPVF